MLCLAPVGCNFLIPLFGCCCDWDGWDAICIFRFTYLCSAYCCFVFLLWKISLNIPNFIYPFHETWKEKGRKNIKLEIYYVNILVCGAICWLISETFFILFWYRRYGARYLKMRMCVLSCGEFVLGMELFCLLYKLIYFGDYFFIQLMGVIGVRFSVIAFSI